MKNILIFLFICFGFALNSQITITCYECKKNTTVDCKGCNIQSNLFTGIVIKEKGKPDIPLYEPYKVSNKSSVFTFEDAFGTKTIVNVTSVLNYNTPKKLYDYLSNCLCKPSTIDTDTDRYSVLIQDSILVTYDINGVEIDRDTIRLFDIDTDTKTFLVQDSILVYYDIQNNEIGRDTIKIPFVDTDIQTYLTQDSILVYYDESNTEIGRDTIRLASSGIVGAAWDASAPQPADGDLLGTDAGYLLLPMPVDKFHSNIVGTAPYDPLLPLTGWVAPTAPIAGNTVEVKFTDGTIGNYTFDGTDWGLDFVVENKAINNLQVVNEIIERGNVSLGGGQPADFTRNTYNWLGANFQDKWQSAGDANLFGIKANQTVNAANTTNSGSGAVNIGTIGANGQYKLNVGGAIWLDNGKSSVIVGRNAGLNDVSTENVLIGDFTGQNNTGDGATFVGRLAGQFNTGSTSTIVGYDAGTNNTGNGLSALGAGAARSNTAANAVFVGNGSGASNTGYQSIGIGRDALRFNSASQSIGIGLFSGMNNTGGSLVSIGNTAAQNNTGNSVVLIGDNAGTLNTGSFSTGIGQGSLNQNSGENAVAYGQYSLGQNSGNDCIGIGFGSLRFNNKSDVIGLGTQTAFTNNASRVIAIGYRAADDFTNPNTPLEGNNVTETILIGSHAGHNQGLASGSEVHSNTIGIGKFALGNSEGSNVIAIGQNAGNTNTQSNRVILGFNELPQFANAAAAAAAMPAASANGVYIYWDLSDNTIKVRP